MKYIMVWEEDAKGNFISSLINHKGEIILVHKTEGAKLQTPLKCRIYDYKFKEEAQSEADIFYRWMKELGYDMTCNTYIDVESLT